MYILNFKTFLNEQESGNNSQGGPFDSLITVVGMSPKDAKKVLEVPQYIASKVNGKNQISAAVANLNPNLFRGKLVGSKVSIDPRITNKTGSNPVYIKNALLKQRLNKITGSISPNDTGDIATLGFPVAGAGGVTGGGT